MKEHKLESRFHRDSLYHINEVCKLSYTHSSADLPHLCPRPVKGTLASSVDPDQTPHNSTFDQNLQCLH